MHLRNFWYVVARSADLRSDKPLARTLDGRPLAVFRDERGHARVLDAVCPHRGSNLAHGRVLGGALACPYHGWRFDGGGRCTHIPSHRPDERIPPTFTTHTFPVVEQQGLIWTSLGAPASAPPRFPALDDTSYASTCYELVAPVPLDWWVENVLDFAHLPFVHRTTIGDERAQLDEFVLHPRSDHLGFIAHSAPRADYSLLSRILKLEVRASVELVMPGHTLFDFDLGSSRRQLVLAIATPEDDRSTRVWNFALRNFLRVPLANTVSNLALRAVLREDLAEGRRSLAPRSLERERMLSTRADELSLEYLRLVRWWRTREAASQRA